MMNSVESLFKHIAKLSELRSLGEIFKDSPSTAPNPRIDFPYNKWSLYIRLIHLLYVPLYTSIISKHFAEFYYIDLFAGSGIGILEPEEVHADVCTESSIPIGGSPFIAMCFAVERQFTSFILVEMNSAKAALLKKRVKRFCEVASQADLQKRYKWCCSSVARQVTPERVVVYNNDANNVVDKVMKSLEERQRKLIEERRGGVHAYVFIDPTGMELKRKSLDRILKSSVRTDILELFNTYGVAVQAINVIHEGHDDKALVEHLGPGWRDLVSEEARKLGKRLEDLKFEDIEEILANYRRQTYEQAGRRVERIPVRLTVSRHFDMFISSPRTRKGNPYFNAFRSIAKYVEEAGKRKYESVDEFVRYICTGELPGLLKYLVDNPEKVMKKYSTLRRYGEIS